MLNPTITVTGQPSAEARNPGRLGGLSGGPSHAGLPVPVRRSSGVSRWGKQAHSVAQIALGRSRIAARGATD
ncbi:MAG: hypothetical protein OXI33_05485, partial [Chloroflexota bacterium]|nr:hypothetical protein [Chloroflexota bacterium]